VEVDVAAVVDDIVSAKDSAAAAAAATGFGLVVVVVVVGPHCAIIKGRGTDRSLSPSSYRIA
jgi:hypothetical protein